MDCSASELDELIYNKMTELKKLNHEHKVLLKSVSSISNSETEALSSELYRLMAEFKYLKESEPEIMPKCDAFLYDWAQHSLGEDIKQKEKILFNLDKMHKESSRKRELLIRRHPNIVYENVKRK
ncbi:hypothetical protein AVEN_136384-1 [Araneus ventricosus]|uniref:Uncharacterized protein n=1 Tax=Araneus ventricosus TaxID=182803 RepID=A0A4Y2M4L5_ARAVE|nr:hypothetical protein AVEN_136384-1 [Araneus ventricosus]